jgi:competence protein ComGC
VEPVPSNIPSVKTSSLAIWSLVLAILGMLLLLVCIGPLFAIPAVICGHMGYSRVKRSGGALQGEGIALGGLITGYVCLGLALFLVPMMAAIAIPNFVKARETAQRNGCINNLRRIEGAKELWALEHPGSTNNAPTMQDLSQYFKGTKLECPTGGTYSINAVGEPPRCSIPKHRLSDSGASIQELMNSKTNFTR